MFIFSATMMKKKNYFIRADTEGDNATYPCRTASHAGSWFFCKDECKEEDDILVETEEKRAQNGRYSIEYKSGAAVELYVTITQLVKSDMRQYKCGYGRALTPVSFYTFPIVVVNGEFLLKIIKCFFIIHLPSV